MKNFISIFLIMGSFSALACNTKVDPSKVILFVDTNNSEMEIATAEKSACDRGEKLVIVPKNYKEYAPIKAKAEADQRALDKCYEKSTNCTSLIEKSNESYKAYDKFKSSQPSFPLALEEAAKEIKEQNAKLQSMIISGHDGGGHFGGEKGQSGRYDIAQLMAKFPEINNVQSLLLLGCYTGVQKEVMEWKQIFPSVKLIGGYDKAAPLSDRPQGHKYITDLLKNEKGLISQSNEKNLLNFTRANLQGFENLNSAIYVQCQGNDQSEAQDLYYSSAHRNQGFTKMEIDACYSNPEIQVVKAEYQKYMAGELEPPKDTSNGALRTLYNKARNLEHCFQVMNQDVNVNNLFNLLFYEGVKKNFSEYYKDDLAKVETDLVLNLDEVIAQSDIEIKKMEEGLQKAQARADLLKNDPEAYYKMKEEELKALEDERDKFYNDPQNAWIRQQLNEDGSQKQNAPTITWNDELQRKINEYYNLQNLAMMNKSILEQERKNPAAGLNYLQMNLQYQQSNIDSQKSAVSNIKAHPERLKNFWIPTEKNLSSKTRKEFLQNIHNMNEVMSLPGLKPDQRQQLMWVNTVTNTHLNYFQNPFSWHEFTGKAEAPESPYPLSLSNGMMGGYVGGSYGGGMTGGMMGGGF